MRSEEKTDVSRVYRSWSRATALACAVLLTPLLTVTAAEPYEGDDYYKAKSFGFGEDGVRWEVPVRTVEEGRELTVTLAIGSDRYPVLNPTEVIKPNLSKLPAFANAFIITDVRDPPVTPDAKGLRFTYKLKPRNRSVSQIPELVFQYFNPRAAPTKSQFRPALAAPVPITVTEAPKPIPKPMWEADRLFAVTTGPEVLDAPFVPSQWAWVAVATSGPLAAGAWFFAWRRIFPDAARMAHLRRSRAARRALDSIRRAHRAPDPPATVAAAVLGYLRTRFPLPDSAVTPTEIGAALVEANVPEEMAEQIADVFRACDRARFAPGDSGSALATEAEAAVTRLEALA